MIKAIVFDIDGVIILGKRSQIYKKLAKSFQLDMKKFDRARRKHIGPALLGKTSVSEYYLRIVRELELNEEKKFIESWKKHLDDFVKLDKSMEKLLITLRKNYVVGALTNVSPSYEKSRNKNKVYQHFDHIIKSFEVKSMKPSLKIYNILLKKLRLPAKEIVFIDDAPKNLPPAKKLGMNTILFENKASLIKELKKLGVKL